MSNCLLDIQPHKVSRDLSGYITYIYGKGKTGKTTLASQMDNALLVAFERGYNALPGVFPYDVTSWSQFKKDVLKNLAKEETKQRFKCVVIDTIDIAAALCEKYMCNMLGISEMGEGGYVVNSWVKTKREFEETLRSIAQMGYAVFFISHDKEKLHKNPDGTEYTQIIPSLSSAYNEIVKNMADIYGYAHSVTREDGSNEVMLTLRSYDGSVDTGCRFKYIAPEVPFNYESLSTALIEAIEKEAEMHDNQYITDESIQPIAEKTYDFNALLEEFNTLVKKIQNNVSPAEFREIWSVKIVEITDKYLGKGKKVGELNSSQAEQLSLIVSDLVDVVNEGL